MFPNQFVYIRLLVDTPSLPYVKGSVIDFVDVQALHFPWVFNVADSAITIGIVLLMIESFFTPRPKPA